MRGILDKIKNNSKKAVIFIGLFLALFVILFYLVNLDINPSQKSSSQISDIPNVKIGEEFKKRLGSTTFSMESYISWAKRFGLESNAENLDIDSDKDGLLNYLEYVHGTNPLKADTDGDSYSDISEITNGYDPDAPGDIRPLIEIAISKINVSAPMVWSKSENEKDMLADLENGVGRYNKTGAPGQNNNMIISGHSSNYIWAKGNYNHIFKDLNNLEIGDIVVVNTTQRNGRNIIYRYRISDKFVTAPDDERIFTATSTSSLTLSTCWPLGTNFRRLIVKAELEK